MFSFLLMHGFIEERMWNNMDVQHTGILVNSGADIR